MSRFRVAPCGICGSLVSDQNVDHLNPLVYKYVYKYNGIAN